ncbi:MAG: hypothetical protein NT031_05410, partial [Planctomycetota bacterium]|nr:hypothetical protein [Planctomycetota bacterium]
QWHLSLLRAFNEVTAHMRRRRILPGEQGVLYEDESGPGVLWAFEDLKLKLDAPVRVRDVTAGSGDEGLSAPSARVEAKARHVYLPTLPDPRGAGVS